MSKNTPGTQFTYNGVGIILSTQGQFCAIVRGIETRTASLAAMRKKIDGVNAFQAFKAVRFERYGDGKFETLTIVGVKKNSRRHLPDLWVDDLGHAHTTVTPDTAMNRKAMQDARAKRKELREIERRHEAELEALEAKVEEIRPPAPVKK